MATLSLRDVRKAFGALTVLDGIHVELEDGGFLVLLGPSGCGKSTLLGIIAGLDRATGGDVLIGGRRVNELPPKDRNIAMVFQSYALYPTMTVARNIGFGLEMRGIGKSARDDAVKGAAALLQVTALLDRRPKDLSGGQRQRVAMGRAIVRDPELFLFDEPLSNLDAKLRVEMRAQIKRLHERLGTTIVYVTHDQVEAMTLGTRVAVMRDGVIQQLADPQTVYDRPANIFVAGFIGSPPMNFIPGILSATADGALFEADGVSLELPGSEHAQAAGAGRAVVLGIRPEDLVPGESGGVLTGSVDIIEPTGPDTYVTLDVAGRAVTARARPYFQASHGQRLSFDVNRLRINLFDAVTEKRIG